MARLKNLEGMRYGRWLVESRFGSNEHNKATWNCICDCGVKRIVTGSSLLNGKSASCGCQHKELLSKKAKHGKRNIREYGIWCAMKSRCQNQNAVNYHNYGGRGVKVCKEWQEFENFYADMGDSNGLTLERIDNSKGYSKENCQWASMKEQGRNKRNNRKVDYQGKELSVSEWADITGLNEATIRRRLNLGWSVKSALFTKPVIGRNQYANS